MTIATSTRPALKKSIVAMNIATKNFFKENNKLARKKAELTAIQLKIETLKQDMKK